MLSRQEIFNKVWNHFIVNGGQRSFDEENGCRYRGPNGTKCAIGIFMTDDEPFEWGKE